jgi:hypothetical protein
MKAVHIVTPEQAETLISCAPEEVVPFFAIGLFAGLRVSEIERWIGGTSIFRGAPST